MATASYRDLKKVCEKLNLQSKKTKSGMLYIGFANDVFCRIIIHIHAEGRDIPDGLFNKYIKSLGFSNENSFFTFLNK